MPAASMNSLYNSITLEGVVNGGRRAHGFSKADNVPFHSAPIFLESSVPIKRMESALASLCRLRGPPKTSVRLLDLRVSRLVMCPSLTDRNLISHSSDCDFGIALGDTSAVTSLGPCSVKLRPWKAVLAGITCALSSPSSA
jgi:hypothetical protein